MFKNIKWQKSLAIIVGSLSSTIILPSAANAAPDAETAYIFNTFSFLIHGFLVALMAAGFCMLEGGLVRVKKCNCTINKKYIVICYRRTYVRDCRLQFDVHGCKWLHWLIFFLEPFRNSGR